MRNADHDSFRPAKQVSKSGQQLIKVYDHICSCLLYHPVDIPDTRHIFVQPENIISYAFDQVDLFILGGRQEVGTFKRIDRRFDLLAKEIWKTAGRTFANQDTNHLMAFVRQLLTERKCLSQMSPAFTLYDKQYFHITSA